MRDFVHHHDGQVPVRRRLGRLLRQHDPLGQGKDHLVDPRVHEVLEENLLAAHFLVNAWIVRKIVGHRLIAVPQVAGAEWRIHHFHRRGMALLRWTVLGRER